MARLIDTSIIVAMQRQGIPLSIVAAALSGEAIGIASITASELLVGVHKADSASRMRQRSEFVESVLDSFPVIGFDLDMARIHARISFELAAAGRTIGSHDLLIAATALTIGYGVMTHNIRHFERVPQLEVSGPGW